MKAVLEKFPNLNSFIQNQQIYLEGVIDITCSTTIMKTSLKIKIEIPKTYPQKLPKTYLLDNTIKRHIDRHISEDGMCCLCLDTIEHTYFNNGINLVDYIEKLVIPFLSNQLYYDKTGEWANGEHDHGVMGQIDFYKKILETNDINTIINALGLLLNYKTIGKTRILGNKKCFCKSGNKINDCCIEKILKLKKINIPHNVLKNNLNEILNFRKNKS